MVERSERSWIWFFALLVITLTTVPYLIGYQFQGSEWRYTGVLIAAEDGNSYLAKMLSGANGDWLFRTPYTPVRQAGYWMQLPYILLGKLSAPPGQHEQLAAIFQLFRIVTTGLLVFALYDFIALFVQGARWRRLGTTLAAVGGGLGWLSALGLGRLWGADMPLEFYSPETFGFLAVLGFPHLSAARALLLWGLRGYLCGSDESPASRERARAALLWTGVAFFQPITLVVGWFVLALHLLITGVVRGGWKTIIWRQFFRRAVWIVLTSSPLIVYTLIAMQVDPYLRVWGQQNRLVSPPVWNYLLAYGAILPLAVLGVRPLLRQHPWSGWLVTGWAAALPLLAYAPVNIQRRLPDGVWIALVILAMKWLDHSASLPHRPAVARCAVTAYLSTSFFSTIILLAGTGMNVWNPHPPLHLPVDEVAAFQFLATSANRRDVVLASFDVSNPLPAWAPVRTVTGHGPESIGGNEMRARVRSFFQVETSEQERHAFLDENRVRYIVWGPVERETGGWVPATAAYLQPVYQNASYTIWKVISPVEVR